MEKVEGKSHIAIIGGGLVGALAACLFAKRGHRVSLYEYRSDIRVEDLPAQSINMALSLRGREALRMVGLEDLVLKDHGVAMNGRMVHYKKGTMREILYDSVKGNCIYSINRRRLNIFLLDAAEKYPEVQLNFNKKLVDADLEKGKMKFLNTKTEVIEDAAADLIIGADGAYSTIRKIISKRPLFNCSQTYIEHGFIELFVAPGENNEFAMSSNNLHVWPRGEFMSIALPNSDRAFTANLFAPFSIFENLKTPEILLSFYNEHFPDLLRLIGEQKLVKDFFGQKAKTLVSVKCKPYHVGKTAVIIGDAAHAMVPFYAQGMNCGFEDLLLFNDLMEHYNSDFAKILSKFSELRCDDAHAICDLAMYNYWEIRELTTRKSFFLRKFIDNVLYTLIPQFWIPLYSTVHFSRMKYRDCIANKEWQDKVLKRCLWYSGFLILVILAIILSS